MAVSLPFMAAAQTVTAKDFKPAEGSWTGTYSIPDASGKIAVSKLTARLRALGRDRFVCSYTFYGSGREDTLWLSGNGRLLNGIPVTARSLTEDNAVELVIEESVSGKEYATATRNIYIIGSNRFQHTILFKKQGSDEWMNGGEYLLAR